MKTKIITFIICLLIITGCTNDTLVLNDESDCSTPNIIVSEKSDEKKESPFEFDSNKVQQRSEQKLATTYEMTIDNVESLGERFIHTIYNDVLCFEEFQMQIISMDLTSNTEALRLTIQFPKGWNQALSEWMVHYGLHISFELNGRPTDMFRQRKINSLNEANCYELLYSKCICPMEEYVGKTISFRPYIERFLIIQSFEPDSNGYKQYALSTGDSFSDTLLQRGTDEFQKGISGTDVSRIYLDNAALSYYIPNYAHITNNDNNEDLIDVIFVEPDWEASNKAGAYLDGSQIEEIRTVYLKTKDFSKASLTLDEFHINESGISLSFSWYFPEDWSDIECQSFIRDKFYFTVFLNDAFPEKIQDVAKDLPFGDGTLINFGSVPNSLSNVNYQNYRDNSYREIHYHNWNSNLSMEEWKGVKSVTILPYMIRFMNKSIPEEGLSYSEYVPSVGEQAWEVVWLKNQAVTVEITQDLFEAGY